MKKVNLILNNGKIGANIVLDCLSILNIAPNQASILMHKAHDTGKSIVFTGSQKDCQDHIKKLKKYAKLRNNNEYNTLANTLLTIESPKKESKEITHFSKEIKKTKMELTKYIKSLGIQSFTIDDSKFDTVNDDYYIDIADVDFTQLAKKSVYNENEIKARFIELNYSGVLSILQ